MDTLQEKEALQNIPFRDDGTIDIVELGRMQLEAMVNQIMDWQADELIRPYSRVDRAMVAIVKEVYVRGLSTRKIENIPHARRRRR